MVLTDDLARRHTKNVDHVKVIKSETCFICLPLSASTCCSKSWTVVAVLCVCAPKLLLLLPVSIIQFSSAARINQSSLRCLLFANNFSLLLSNSFELFYWRWNFYCILSFLFIFAYNFAFTASTDAAAAAAAVDAGAATASREYTNYVNFCFFIQDYSN